MSLAEKAWWCQHKPSPPSRGFAPFTGLLFAGCDYDYLHLCSALGFQTCPYAPSRGILWDGILLPLCYGRLKAGRDLRGDLPKVSSSKWVQPGCVQSVHLGRGNHKEARAEPWWSGRPGLKSQLRPSRLIGFGQVNSPRGTSVSSSVKEGSWLVRGCCEDSKKQCL